MPNAFGTLAAPLILQRALELTYRRFPILSEISMNLSTDAVLWNQQVITRILQVPPVVDFSTAAGTITTTDVSVTVNQFKKVEFQILPTEYTATDRDLLEEQAEPIAVAIGSHMTAAIAALWLPANYPDPKVTEAVADCGHSTIVKGRSALNSKGVANMGRFHVANGAVYEKYLLDPIVNQVYNDRDPQNPVVDGVIRGIAGFSSIQEYQDFPTSLNRTGFFGTRSSTIYVGRVPKNPGELYPGLFFPGVWRIISDPSSGLSVLYTAHENPDTLNVTLRACWMYGVAVGDPKQGVIMVSA